MSEKSARPYTKTRGLHAVSSTGLVMRFKKQLINFLNRLILAELTFGISRISGRSALIPSAFALVRTLGDVDFGG